GAGRCAGITRSASADLATLVSLVRMDPLRGAVVLPNGHRLAATLDELDLIGLMYSGDFDPVLRAALPAALRAALDGDSAPILRLLLWSSVGEGIGNAGEFSTMDNLATLCEDSTLPWPRTSATADH